MNADTADICERLSKLGTGIVWDVLRVMGLPHQALSSRIVGLEPSMKLCGPAFCIKGQTWLGTPPKPDPDKPQPRYELFKHLYAGCVVVVDSGSYDEGVVMGENFAVSIVGGGGTGFIVDGGIRDSQAFVDRKIPTFLRFVTPVSSAGRWSITAFEVPISLPGQTSASVAISPGDVILADRDGVVVIPRQHASDIAGYAERVDEIEQIQRAELIAGSDDRQRVYERHDRFGHIRKP
ncbi:hypothetical protein BH09PSE5_BH09PSE5_00540 [soil metagenome]